MIVTHLRCGMIFSDAMDQTRLYPILKKELLEENQATLFGKGQRVINYIFIEELIPYLSRIIELKIAGVYNVVEHSDTTLQLATKIAIKEGVANPKIILIDKGNFNKFIVNSDKLKHII